nr:putative cytochrome P450 [Tanacetum cinerariifolium]
WEAAFPRIKISIQSLNPKIAYPGRVPTRRRLVKSNQSWKMKKMRKRMEKEGGGLSQSGKELKKPLGTNNGARNQNQNKRITITMTMMVEVAELRILRWTCGKIRVDMISNGVFRATLDIDSIIDKMREGRLRWFGHAKRRPQSVPVRRVEAMVVEGSRRRDRPKLRWEDRLKMDMKELRLSEDMTSDRNTWRDRIWISK